MTISATPAHTRYLNIDILRGLMLLLMAHRHLDGSMSNIGIHLITFFTEAEVFVFLSGLIAGLMAIQSSSTTISFKKILGRASKLYLYHIAVFLFIAAMVAGGIATHIISADLLTKYGLTSLSTSPVTSLSWAGFFLYQPRYLDILPMFIASALFLPIALHFMRKGFGWVVLAISSIIWLISQVMPAFGDIAGHITSSDVILPGYFNIMAWQFLFVIGAFIGTLYHKKPAIFISPKTHIIAISAVLVLVLFRLYLLVEKSHPFLGIHIQSLPFYDLLENKPRLGLIRIVDVTAWAYLAYWSLSRFSFPQRIGKWVAELGEHSIDVFCFHVVLVYSVIFLRHYAGYGEIPRHSEQMAIDLAILPCVLVALWLPVVLRKLLTNNKNS